MVTPNAGRITTSSGPRSPADSPGIGRGTGCPGGPQLLVDVRVVDDLAGEEHPPVGKARAGLVGVVDGAVHPVAEAEFASQVDRQPTRTVAVAVGLDLLDQRAAVTGLEHAGDLLLEVEPFAENQRWHQR